ncbi:30S ribosomal S17 [Tripterygium wilfordii]|uniref:30S ribosomal S17 n=1 Tax=Tripterygium wilfordii TaxID=458696 RepID=A0A7J7DV57_TRIWF|nr:30S ribosomal S17 [Tripterygium wilfordii]
MAQTGNFRLICEFMSPFLISYAEHYYIRRIFGRIYVSNAKLRKAFSSFASLYSSTCGASSSSRCLLRALAFIQKKKPMKSVVGMVVSNKMQKSVVVAVDRLFHHKIYNRYVKRTSKFMAHDEKNECNIGDRKARIYVPPAKERPANSESKSALPSS